jgi:hypothetical protein
MLRKCCISEEERENEKRYALKPSSYVIIHRHASRSRSHVGVVLTTVEVKWGDVIVKQTSRICARTGSIVKALDIVRVLGLWCLRITAGSVVNSCQNITREVVCVVTTLSQSRSQEATSCVGSRIHVSNYKSSYILCDI